jgi:hypothetical protein
MRVMYGFAFSAAVALAATSLVGAQAQPDGAVAVKGGGVFAKGWTGKIDSSEEKAGQVLNNAKLTQAANGSLEVTTGPATTYWNPGNKATGDYTVKATFTESNYMGLNDHPHPYGIVIGGNDLGTPTQSFIYCAAYGNGTFIVRGMGPDPFQVSPRRPETNEAVHKAAGKGSSVTQEIAVTVKGDAISCAINGKTVGTYPKADVVGAGKLKSTDGVYGIRFAHNTSAVVTGLAVTKP